MKVVQITDVQVNLCENSDDRLRAYCAIVIDNEFVVHNIRIIEKSSGLLVAMPSRKLTFKCYNCRFKNPIDANYCMNCGKAAQRDDGPRHSDAKIHFDVAHPINPECRRTIESSVLKAYREAVNGVVEKAV